MKPTFPPPVSKPPQQATPATPTPRWAPTLAAVGLYLLLAAAVVEKDCARIALVVSSAFSLSAIVRGSSEKASDIMYIISGFSLAIATLFLVILALA